MKTLTKNQAVIALAEHGYQVLEVRGCRKRTGTGYLITGEGYRQEVNLGRLRQMAQNVIEGRPAQAG